MKYQSYGMFDKKKLNRRKVVDQINLLNIANPILENKDIEVILETFWELKRKLTNDEQHAYNRILDCYSKIPKQKKSELMFFTRNEQHLERKN